MKCYICGEEAIQRHGRANRCEKHHRMLSMQKVAKQDKKYVPSIFELEKLVPVNMACGDCGKKMHWIDDDARADGAVLQHYRDGTIAITCFSCNTKHGNMVGDSYRELPKDHKHCSSCKTIKPLDQFSRRNDAKKSYPMTKCKLCMREAYAAWRLKNPEAYKALTKKHNLLKKEKSNAANAV
jgi:bacterioferritin-associated ferredoxin